MLQSRPFWIVLVLAAAAAVVVSARSFDRAFPLVSLELELDRRGALAATERVAKAQGWATEGYRQAASFGQRDEELKRYIELEAGGPSAWNRLVESGEHHTYLWRVRRYLEGEALEADVRFTADGSPWGYLLRVPEDLPGATLDTAPARRLAESAAVSDWGVDLSVYRPVESRQEVRPGGRVDHWFVYERPDLTYGDARFRLRLGVAGDAPSEVTRFTEVPEGFQRRYAELRSANNLIALLASLSSGLLYLVLGAGVGLVLLLRQGWVVWRQPVLWGGIVGGLMMAASLNELPLLWMGYDTAVPRGGFLASQLLGAAGVGLGTALFVALVVLAGESLSRRAFPGHVQLWRLWSPAVASSRPLLGMTVGGYVFAAFFVAWAVGFYLFATGVLGWPVSSETLLHPDMLATPFPWLSAVAISLMAGFSEEAMFRAIPLAGAALIAARYGRRGLWIGVALVVQALIFAAAHANYPQQPSYARVVELFVPAMALGMVFLRWGFAPAVIAHFAYDMVWFSVPVFTSSAPGTWVNQALLVGLGLLPLAIVLIARARHGATDDVPAAARNAAWRPPDPASSVEPAPGPGVAAPGPGPRTHDGGPATPPGAGLPRGLVRWAPALGLAGVALWAATETFRPVSSPLEVGARAAALAAADALAEHLGDASGADGWRLLPTAHDGRSTEHRFVWETAGPEAHAALLGTHLDDAHWRVRAARFDGPLDERAEELFVHVDGRGEVRRIRHTLPEERPGPALAEAEARERALATASELWGLDATSLTPVSAAASQRPARMDWTFTFGTPATGALEQGESRARVTVAGDRVADALRFVHIPQQWERERRADRTRAAIIGGIGLGLLFLLGIGALVVGIARLARRQMPMGPASAGWLAGTVLIGVGVVNGWPATIADLSTSEPYGHQLVTLVAVFGFLALVGGSVAGLLAGLGHAWAGQSEGETGSQRVGGPAGDWRPALRVGLPAGALLAGILTAAGRPAGAGPPWGSYGGADAAIPALAAALAPIQSLFITTLAILAAIGALGRLPVRGRRGVPTRALLASVIGLAVAGGIAGSSILHWVASAALVVGLLFAGLTLVRRTGAGILPAIAAAGVLLSQIPAILHGPYPGARPGLVLGSILLLPLAALWARWLPSPAMAAHEGPAPTRRTVAAGTDPTA